MFDNMELTKEEMKMVKGYLPIIESIIVNHSCSNMGIAFRTDMKKLADKMKLNFCTTCSSGIFNIVSRVYRQYNEQKLRERKKKCQEKVEN